MTIADANIVPASQLQQLKRDVIDAGLCIMCGACLNHCPHIVRYKGRVVVLDDCDRNEAECYGYCPRTPTDWDLLSQTAFGVPYNVDGIGTVRNVFLCRSTSSQIHHEGQDGGVITALLTVALESGLIDAAVEARIADDKSSSGFVARDKEGIIQCAGNNYEASFSLEAFNSLPRDNTERLAVVGLPCQIEALTKMRASASQTRASVENIKFALGLFCGWALLPFQFHRYLREKIDLQQVVKFDIPHHPADTFDIYTTAGVESIKLDDIREFINPACSYCLDMTSEFADISVGSGRRIFGWNTVIIRSKRGEELFEKARANGLLETAPLPSASLEHLKVASLNKKKRALGNIIEKSGSKDNPLYLKGPFTKREAFSSLIQ